MDETLYSNIDDKGGKGERPWEVDFRACLYGGEMSLVGGLPSPPSYLLPSVYMRKLSLLAEPKLGPLGSKEW